MKKDLNSYFDDWIVVATNNKLIENEVVEWCENNFGLRALKWDVRWITMNLNDVSPSRKSTRCYMFKTDQDAMMFILRWGGNIIKKQ